MSVPLQSDAALMRVHQQRQRDNAVTKRLSQGQTQHPDDVVMFSQKDTSGFVQLRSVARSLPPLDLDPRFYALPVALSVWKSGSCVTTMAAQRSRGARCFPALY